MSVSDEFHAHLDVCTQCEKNPFDLCEIGARLLREAGEKAAKFLREKGITVPGKEKP